MEKRNKTLLISIAFIIIVILLVFILTFLGIKGLKGKRPKSNDPVESTSSIINKNDEPVDNILAFPNNDDKKKLLDDLLDLLPKDKISTNFKNLKYEKDGDSYTYDCDEYQSKCLSVKLTLNNGLSLYVRPFARISDVKLYKFKNYYIKTSDYDDAIDLALYNSTGEVMSTKAALRLFINGQTINTRPVVSDNKLYYVEISSNQFDDGTYNCDYNYVDFSNNTINKIKTIKARVDNEIE